MRWVSGEETAFSKYRIGSRKAVVYGSKIVISGNLLAFGLVPCSHRGSARNMRLAARYAWARTAEAAVSTCAGKNVCRFATRCYSLRPDTPGPLDSRGGCLTCAGKNVCRFATRCYSARGPIHLARWTAEAAIPTCGGKNVYRFATRCYSARGPIRVGRWTAEAVVPRVHGGFLLRLPQPSKHPRRWDSLRLLDGRYPLEH